VLFVGSARLFDRYVTRGVYWGGGRGVGETYVLVQIRLPRGSSLERTDQLVEFFEQKLATMPGVEHYSAHVLPEGATVRVTFPDSLDESYVPLAVKEEMFAYSTSFTGAEVRVFGYGAAFSKSFYEGGGMAPHYAVQVRGYNYEMVREIAEDLGGRLARITRIEEVDTNASGRFTVDRATEYAVRIDRDALARHDVSVEELVARIQPVVGGSVGVRELKLGGEEVQYRVKLEAARKPMCTLSSRR